MGKFDGILICTDLDHTLIRCDGTLSDENVEAIKYFMANGGMFTLSSGRPPLYLKKFHDKFIPNVPVIAHNGSTLYDYRTSSYIRSVFLDNSVIRPVNTILDECPGEISSITFYDMDKQYNYESDSSASLEEYIAQFDKANKNKILLHFFSSEKAHQMQVYLDSLEEYKETFEFSRSWEVGLEILPGNGNKASGVKALCDYLGNVSLTVCIGDFENDVSMLKFADIGYAVSNACQSAKDAADRITVSNDESAIAKIISEL